VKPINLISVVVAVASGVITLLLILFGVAFGFADILPIILGWVTTLIAVALLVGVLNLVAVQGRKVSALNLNSIYGVIFFVAFFSVIFMWMLAAGARTFLGTDDPLREQLVGVGQGTVDFAFNYIQTPVEASLTALLAIVMVLGGARLVRTRRHWSALLFVGVTLVLLIGIAPIGGLGLLGSLRTSLNDLFIMGATRGLLLAISLGVIATGVRVIIGVDRPYGE
jgi:hypothetical protein